MCELQVLDNSAYNNLHTTQYHGSAYGMVAARRGFLKKHGEWNTQEVTVKGHTIKVVLNDKIILDTNLKENVTKPMNSINKYKGRLRTEGHFGFMGHGSTVQFRNIRIKHILHKSESEREKRNLKTDEEDLKSMGFTSLFNGKNLDGWWGLGTEDPSEWMNLPKKKLEEKKKQSIIDIQKHWKVINDDIIFNDGEGLYLTTEKNYGNFELYLDYKTVANADLGIYLRGIPQVQIWDYTKEGGKWKLGADKGSGGLWNNSKDDPGKLPLEIADKPFGEWNTLYIKMIGNRVTVKLNGKLVVNNATLNNFWDRKTPIKDRKPIIKRGPIQLQTHRKESSWRRIYIKELN